ncbi:14718_t:CDS:2, partial [Cetraspora pellucida]
MHPKKNTSLKWSGPQVKQKQWFAEYKHQYRIKKCAEPKNKKTLIEQRQKNTTYKCQYRARKNANKLHKNHSSYENESWWDVLYALSKTAIQPLIFTWTQKCSHCSITLLTGESAEFCCNRGKRILPLLPSYPTNMDNILNDRGISILSRKLNALFSFMAIGVQGQFVHHPSPSFVCITGRTYHHRGIPNEWVLGVQSMLTHVNLYVHSLRMFQDDSSPTTLLELRENTSTGEVAAIIHANNTINISLRSIVVWHYADVAPKFINILSSQYEPLQYLLLFPHRTPGWHPNNYYNLSQIDWYHCRLLCEQRFLSFGRLTSEYLVDMYSHIEEERLNYILNEKNCLNKEKKTKDQL